MNQAEIRPTTRCWHILWSPAGFGANSNKLVEIWKLVRSLDKEFDVFYPAYVDHLGEKEVLVPLYPDYAFVHCIYNYGVEDIIRARCGPNALFLKMIGSINPYVVSEDEMHTIKAKLAERAKMVKIGLHRGDLAIKDRVTVRGTHMLGTVLYFVPPNRVMLEVEMFNQLTPVLAKVSDLGRL